MPPLAIATQSIDIEDISLVGDDPSLSVEKSPKTKGVRINLEQNDICVIPPLSDYSREEVANIWLSRGESEIIREAALETITKLNTGEPFEHERETSRGLEFFTYNGALKREYNKLRLRRAVLEEQERQRDAGMCDTEKIAFAASRCTIECADFALDIAADDEDSVYGEIDEYEEETLIKKASSMRPALSLCCWDLNLSCFIRWR